MDLKQMEYFVASVDSGSFKRASEILYTSQPHISKTIKSLETELHMELLQRTARGVNVTAAGRKVYEYACRILVEAGKIQNVREDADARVLSIAANPSDRLTELFRKFYVGEMKTGIQTRYLECGTEEIFRLVHRHQAEQGFVYIDEKQMTVFRQMLEYRHLSFQELEKTEPLLLTGPKSPLYHAPYVTMKELRELDYVQMQDEQDTLSIQILQRSEDYQYHRRRGQVLITSSRYLLVQTILETPLCSISYGICPGSAGSELLHGIPVRGAKDSITFGYIQRKRDGISSEGRRFVEFVKNHLIRGGKEDEI